MSASINGAIQAQLEDEHQVSREKTAKKDTTETRETILRPQLPGVGKI
jgi:hypothetical protein